MKKILMLLVLSLILVGCGQNNNPQAPETEVPAGTNTTKEVSVAESKKFKSYFDGNIVETENIKIELQDYKVILPGEEGNEYGDVPIIGFWYNVTNKGSDPLDSISAWVYIFKAIQDNDPNLINELAIGMTPDARYLESAVSQIKPGGSIDSAVSYTLTDMETPVTLIASDEFVDTELGRVDFKIK